MQTNVIHTGDAIEVLRSLPDESVHCCVTSPPYWSLRDYGVDGQIGLEATPEKFVEKMVAVFREVRRVLRADATCWLNLGDSYMSDAGKQGLRGRGGSEGKQKYILDSVPLVAPNRFPSDGIKPKELVGIPWRVALALQADGWYLRQDIVWAKPNPMPESIKDRCTKSHEYIFLLTKSERYYFDHEAIQEPAPWKDCSTGVGFGHGYDAEKKHRVKVPAGWDTDPGSHGRANRKYTFARKTATPLQPGQSNTSHREERPAVEYKGTRNKRSVWSVPTFPYKGAHFATFPPDLIKPCILAGCPEGGIVLDPFIGSGTVGVVATNLRRKYVGIEINPAYVTLAEARILREGNHTGCLFEEAI